MIEVFEPGSPEEEMLFSCLTIAKGFQDDPVGHPNGVLPTAFIFGSDGGLTLVNLATLFDASLRGGKDAAAEEIRKIAASVDATFWALLCDTWVTLFKALPEELLASGLDINDYRSWSQADKDRFPTRRREALLVLMESRTAGDKQLRQHYRRENGKVVWEECDVSTGIDPSGRFVGLLPKGEAQQRGEAEDGPTRNTVENPHRS